jgi:two-component system sporulation sensor kinase B
MIERILLNVFFVLLPVILLPIVTRNNYDKYVKIRTSYIFIGALLTSFACMIFTIKINNFISFDFQFIPQLYASLFLGPSLSILFVLLAFVFKILFGGQEILFAVILSVSHIVLSFAYSKKFNNSTSDHRIFNFTVIHIVTGVFAFLYLYLTTDARQSYELVLWFLAQAFAAFLLIFFSEYIRTNLLLHSKIINTEKMDIVSHLAASISHEVRNPLTTVRGFLQLLSQMDNNDKSKEYIHISIEELDRAEAIISDYLSFAKPSINKRTTLDLNSEFTRMIDIMKPLANQYNVVIDSKLQKDLFVIGEQQSFQQCFINIIKNSIEAMYEGGGTLSIITSVKSGRIFIKIFDNGIGMTKQQLERIGEPYFSTKGSKGTGLGMMVVFKIVESMCGTININSEIGKGTEIITSFPLQTGTPALKEVAVGKADPKTC